MGNIEKMTITQMRKYIKDLEKLEELLSGIKEPVIIPGKDDNYAIVCEDKGKYGVVLPNGLSYAIAYNEDGFSYYGFDSRIDYAQDDKTIVAMKRDMNSYLATGGQVILPVGNQKQQIIYRCMDEESKKSFQYLYDASSYLGNIFLYVRYLNEKNPANIQLINSNNKLNEFVNKDSSYYKVLFSILGNALTGSKEISLEELKNMISDLGFDPKIDNDIITLLTGCNETKILLDASVGLYKNYLGR